MRIVRVGQSSDFAPTARRAENDARHADAPETDARTLIPIEATAAGERGPRVTRHPAAGFLTQLIATRLQAPQTRARRRAGSEEATAVYRSMTKPVALSRQLRRRA